MVCIPSCSLEQCCQSLHLKSLVLHPQNIPVHWHLTYLAQPSMSTTNQQHLKNERPHESYSLIFFNSKPCMFKLVTLTSSLIVAPIIVFVESLLNIPAIIVLTVNIPCKNTRLFRIIISHLNTVGEFFKYTTLPTDSAVIFHWFYISMSY